MNKALVAALAGILGLAIGIAIGILARPKVGLVQRVSIFPGPSTDPKPLANPDYQTIQFDRGDLARWDSVNHRKLEILFKAADFDPNSTPNPTKEPPFAGGIAGQDQAILCANGTCTSPNINPNLEDALKKHGHLEYKYWQTLNGVPRDGHIIIQK